MGYQCNVNGFSVQSRRYFSGKSEGVSVARSNDVCDIAERLDA